MVSEMNYSMNEIREEPNCMADSDVSSKFLLKKVWEVAQNCVDEKKKGWSVKMEEFGDAMDALDFGRKQVREALEVLEYRELVITFADENDHLKAIGIVPQRYQCWHCNMWLDMQNDPEGHMELCLRRQKKIERNLMLNRGWDCREGLGRATK
jgi:hypothetical protein